MRSLTTSAILLTATLGTTAPALAETENDGHPVYTVHIEADQPNVATVHARLTLAKQTIKMLCKLDGRDRRWLQPGFPVQIEVGGNQQAVGFDKPAQVPQPADRDSLVYVEQFSQDGVHRQVDS